MELWYPVTLLGEPQAWAWSTVIIALAYLILRERLSPAKRKLFKKVLYIYIPGVATTLLIVLLMKTAISAERPCIPCVNDAAGCNPYCDTDSSFPSGHTAAIFSVVTSLCLSLRKKQLLPLYIIALLVAFSRYFLGVHWPADLATGAAIGIAVPCVFSLVYKKEYEKWA